MQESRQVACQNVCKVTENRKKVLKTIIHVQFVEFVYFFSLGCMLMPLKINKGDYEGEVVIFGSSAAQQKAKEMIEDLVACGHARLSNGMIYKDLGAFCS